MKTMSIRCASELTVIWKNATIAETTRIADYGKRNSYKLMMSEPQHWLTDETFISSQALYVKFGCARTTHVPVCVYEQLEHIEITSHTQ